MKTQFRDFVVSLSAQFIGIWMALELHHRAGVVR